MQTLTIKQELDNLGQSLEGELAYDKLMTAIYSTDASVYREIPLAVAIPKQASDLKKLIHFANQQQLSLIPRAAGTSLAGQCVGNGIVVDTSKYFNKIIEFNDKEAWVRVQPGVIRDELNAFLKPHGFFFSPITSTANRAMIGGMVGNNACGTTSIEYGSTRDHVLELKVILSDGSEVIFNSISKKEFEEKCDSDSLEGKLYREIKTFLSPPEVQERIIAEFPKPEIHRRNTGYAVDELLKNEVFSENEKEFNFCKLLCGSEGTLAFTTEIKLHVDPLPDPVAIVVAAHFNELQQSLNATQVAMNLYPSACELMDKIILDCTKENIEQSQNRFFVEGDPAAILCVEFRGKTVVEAEEKAKQFSTKLQSLKLGYAYPFVQGLDIPKVWKLRAAGLGLLANIPGDKKAVACIEDTAVALEDLPEYIEEFSSMMESFDQQAVYYAHAGAGELHLRPILDLKKSADVQDFYKISEASARLVKKYNGSLSGEHGDGRVRGPFIPIMVGHENYQLFKDIKKSWDPNNIFNPGKIVEAAPMTEQLRYEPDLPEKSIDTLMDFSNTGGILRAAEKCNGSGDCRKLPLSGGTMCPSYQATRDEKDTTRARANVLREFLTQSESKNPFDQEEIKQVMDLCISCKGCTSECPSNVDMSSLKAEFLHQYQKSNGIPWRSILFANINRINTWGSIAPSIFNFLIRNKITGGLAKKILQVAPQRNIPAIHKLSLKKWVKNEFLKNRKTKSSDKKLFLFIDEFTDWNDTPVGIKAIQLLDRLGYEVLFADHAESGRAGISKGLLELAQRFANKNVSIFKSLISKEVPLVGIEPSAILTFRDEYPRLVNNELKVSAKNIAPHCLLIDEFIAGEINKGNISSQHFSQESKKILLHGHCHQKALSDIKHTVQALSIPAQFHVEVIPSGCCGMAGSFGYEAEHYTISQQIGNLVLFPAVKKADSACIIAAPGTSCRHQIKDGTGKLSVHPIEILFNALRA